MSKKVINMTWDEEIVIQARNQAEKVHRSLSNYMQWLVIKDAKDED